MTVPGEALLQVTDLRMHIHTRRGAVKAVDGVSFALYEGETLGIVGESGSGKSMLCLSVIGLLPHGARVVDGSVTLSGRELTGLSARELRDVRGSQIAFIPQDPNTSLDPVFTVGSQLRETLALDGLRSKGATERATELLKSVRIAAPTERLRSIPYELSGGTKQRVAGAIALARSPRVLIADEPTTALDVTTQAAYLRLLRDLQRSHGLSIMLVTHDLGVVASACDRVAVMYAGRIVETGPVRDVLERPQHPYTRALVAATPPIDERLDRLAVIEGQPPALHDVPPGCPFAPRCDERVERCGELPLLVGSGDRAVACWVAQAAGAER